MGNQVERAHGKVVVAEGLEQERRQLADWGVPHLCADKLGGTTGVQDRPHNPGY